MKKYILSKTGFEKILVYSSHFCGFPIFLKTDENFTFVQYNAQRIFNLPPEITTQVLH